MANNINVFDTYYMLGVAEEIVPETSFFRDRYFPESVVFEADKVLMEYRDGDRKLAPFVADRVGGIATSRRGYELNEFSPALIAPKRTMTVDDLKKRGFGEALYSGTTQAERAVRLLQDDLTDLTRQITRREEWMAVQTMLNNGLTMQEYLDADTVGDSKVIRFYSDDSNPAAYTVGAVWTTWALMYADVVAMCDKLAEKGHPVEDLILGSAAWSKIKDLDGLQKALDTENLHVGELRAQLKYPGVAFMGTLNFDGYELNIIVDKQQYEDSGTMTNYFPAKGAMVTAPACGHRLYGQVTQIPWNSADFETVAGERIPKLNIDATKNIKELVLSSRPLTAPKTKSPWIYAAAVVS